MSVFFHIVSLGSTELFFLFDKAQQPMIKIQNTDYHTLNHLLLEFPLLTEPSEIEKLAQVANFLARGLEFQIIENLDFFKQMYHQQIENESFTLNSTTLKLKDYGIFDLSLMHPPHLIHHKLVFFVKHDYLSIPYQASLYPPFNQDPMHLSYELLPLL